MSAKGLTKLIKKLEDIGTFEGKSVTRRKPIASTSVANMAIVLNDGLIETMGGLKTCSEWEIARYSETPIITVHNILFVYLSQPDSLCCLEHIKVCPESDTQKFDAVSRRS